MAKYEIRYACGHGTYTEQLFGKHKDRESRIAWLERNKVCPECYKAQMAKENAAKGLRYHVRASIRQYMPARSANIEWAFFFIEWFDGDTMPNKDAIKAAGYWWDELDIVLAKPLSGLFENRPPRKCWNRETIIKIADLAKGKTDEEIIQALADKGAEIVKKAAETFPQAKIDTEGDLIDTLFLGDAFQRCMKEIRALQEIKKPRVPAWLANQPWNGKVYGRQENEIYLDGHKKVMNSEEKAEFLEWRKLLAEYKAKVQAIKTGK